jgi:predicted transcriptional regulator
MPEVKKLDLEDPDPIVEALDQETLDAIDEALREDDADEVVPIEEVRKLLPQWITASSSRRER